MSRNGFSADDIRSVPAEPRTKSQQGNIDAQKAGIDRLRKENGELREEIVRTHERLLTIERELKKRR